MIGTTSERNRAMVASLGADEVIDYRARGHLDSVHDVDIVLDTVGGDCATRSLSVVRRGGAIVSLALNTTTPLGEVARERGIGHRLMLVEHDNLAMPAI